MTELNLDDYKKLCVKCLEGIESDDVDIGWWETSGGVEFGQKKLAEVLNLIETMHFNLTNTGRNHSKKLSTICWAVHDTQADYIFTDTIRKSKQGSVDSFLNNHGYDVYGILTDEELYEQHDDQDRYVCNLVEIKLVEGM